MITESITLRTRREEMSFINLSNHISTNWSEAQINAAREYGEIIDYPFPGVSVEWDEVTIDKMSDEIVGKVISMKPKAVMCQGEFTMCFNIVRKLLKKGVCVVSACSERNCEEVMEGGVSKKIMYFEFVRFRNYVL